MRGSGSKRPTGGHLLTAGCAACWGTCCRTIGAFGRPCALAVLGKPFAPLLAWVGLKPVAAMIRLAPAALPSAAPAGPQTFPAEGARRGRVALMAGCVTPVIGPSIIEATIGVLTRHGIEVVLPAGQGCCGGIVHHLGRDDEALAAARHNIDAWDAELTGGGLDAILITASGCGTTVKDYGFMLRDDSFYATSAARISALAKDICEYLAQLDLSPQRDSAPLVVAYHAACSLQHGQKVTRAPKEVLSAVGYVVRDVPEGHLVLRLGRHLQHSAAGHREEVARAQSREYREDDARCDCSRQYRLHHANRSGHEIPVVHTVELIDWATGGRVPPALQAKRAVVPV